MTPRSETGSGYLPGLSEGWLARDCCGAHLPQPSRRSTAQGLRRELGSDARDACQVELVNIWALATEEVGVHQFRWIQTLRVVTVASKSRLLSKAGIKKAVREHFGWRA